MLLQKQRKNNAGAKPGRFLITINVVGSSGPIRFVVNEDDDVAGVIDTGLKSYAREGRLPLLGSDANNFLLYCANSESDGKATQTIIVIFLLGGLPLFLLWLTLKFKLFLLCEIIRWNYRFISSFSGVDVFSFWNLCCSSESVGTHRWQQGKELFAV